MCRGVFSVEDMLTYFHLDNQLNMELDQGCADFWIWLYSRHFKASVYVNIVYVRELICMCAFASELLLVHLWHTSAPVPGHLPPDWLHHGLETERVWGRHSFCKGRPTVRHFTVYYKVVDLRKLKKDLQNWSVKEKESGLLFLSFLHGYILSVLLSPDQLIRLPVFQSIN